VLSAVKMQRRISKHSHVEGWSTAGRGSMVLEEHQSPIINHHERMLGGSTNPLRGSRQRRGESDVIAGSGVLRTARREAKWAETNQLPANCVWVCKSVGKSPRHSPNFAPLNLHACPMLG
jgi:hypothetical protein